MRCFTPQEAVCDGAGEQQCTTVLETACTTKYVKHGPDQVRPTQTRVIFEYKAEWWQVITDTACEKLPRQVCGSGCRVREGEDRTVASLVDIPQETCDLNPVESCSLETKLVPVLRPQQECSAVPREVCSLQFGQPELVRVPLRTEWCLEDKES